jgi:flagellar hook-associated protein 3 FlgL
MRITNDTLRMVFLNALETSQRQLAETQAQVSTGKRIITPSDDPIAAARIGQLDASLARLDQYQANGIIARNQLGLEEEALASVIDNLQRVRELAIQANNGTLDNSNRSAVAAELRQRLDSVLALANSTDASGRYLFAGTSEDTQPFVVTAGGVVYNGDHVQRSLQVSDERLVAVNDSGADVFQRIRNGNGTFRLAADGANTGTAVLGAGSIVNPAAYVADDYTITFSSPTDYEVRDGGGALLATGTFASGQSVAFAGIDVSLSGEPAAGDVFTVTPSTTQDVFTTLRSLVAALETPVTDAASRAALHNQVGQLLVDIDQATTRVIETRAEIGARLRALDQESSLNEGFSVQLTETLSEIRDLDYAAALSLLSEQLFGLEAAQKTFSRTQGLSLFRFIQ